MASADSIQTHSAELKKELGLGDLILTQILYVVGSHWVGTAAKLGSSQVVFWMLAVVWFYIPLTAVVIYLNRIMPLEGGLYQWAKLGFNNFIGFLVGWNLWLYIIVFMSSQGMTIATNIAYAFGVADLGASKWFILLVTCTLVGFLIVVTVLGLGVGKWFQNAGGIAQIMTFGTLLLIPLLSLKTGGLRQYHPLAMAMPAFSLFSLNILGKISFGAFSGFEYVAILAGECKSPVRSIGRSVLIASPIIALMFILGTSSILAYVSPDNIDVIGPIPQALRVALGGTRLGGVIVPVAVLFLLTNYLSSFSLNFAANTRLPMCAGWDHLLPQWFTQLHPRFRTPVNSIFFLGGITLAASIAVLAGVGAQEAFELLLIWAFTFYAIAYLALFAIPVLAGKQSSLRGPLWMKVLASFGFLMTLLFVVLSIFPIIPVASQSAYSAKTVAVIVVANLAGLVLYYKRPKPA